MATNRSTTSRFVLSLLTLSSITLLALGPSLNGIRGRVRDSLRPARNLGGSITAPIDDAVGKARNYRALKEENARLIRERDEAKASAYKYDDAVRENRELLMLGKFRDPNGYKSVNARVVSLGGSNFEDKVELDRGANDGVVLGAPIVTAAGLVGRVVRVYPSSSDAALITDPELKVGVRLAKSGDVGIATGLRISNQRTPRLVVNLVGLDAKPEIGEMIVTSGLQKSAFPPGLPVGIVRKFKPGAINLDLTIDPVVDLRPSHLSFVKVLLVKATPTPTTVALP